MFCVWVSTSLISNFHLLTWNNQKYPFWGGRGWGMEGTPEILTTVFLGKLPSLSSPLFIIKDFDLMCIVLSAAWEMKKMKCWEVVVKCFYWDTRARKRLRRCACFPVAPVHTLVILYTWITVSSFLYLS